MTDMSPLCLNSGESWRAQDKRREFLNERRLFCRKSESMSDKGQEELGDVLKEGAAALVQMRKGIENACTGLRTVYSKRVTRYLRGREQADAAAGLRGSNDISGGSKLLSLLPIDKSRLP
jgi:hypothetical protein